MTLDSPAPAGAAKIDSTARPLAQTAYLPELVLGFVAPTGIRSVDVKAAVTDRLKAYGYRVQDVHLSRRLEELSGTAGQRHPKVRVKALQEAGDLMRTFSESSDAMAYIAIREIAGARTVKNEPLDKAKDEPIPQLAYVVWSLKHRDEVQLLRQMYRSRFFLFSVYSPRERRQEAMARLIADNSGTTRSYKEFMGDAAELIERDEREVLDEGDYGQDVRDAYPLADFFIDGSSRHRLGVSIGRALDIVFGDPFATPTIDEFAMYVAHAAGLRSAELGRQVGASIATDNGDVVATGTNEVPAFGGGHYWSNPLEPMSAEDNREYLRDSDTSDRTKRLLAREIFDALKLAGAIDSGNNLTDESIYQSLELTGLRELTEFGRAVHGEMSVLMDAARRGVSVKGLTLYVTTFPCHQCSRHVVAAGIRRLVYIYPYPKSRTDELHGDVIQTSELAKLDTRRVHYESFLGVAPRAYPSAFTMYQRKNDRTGQVLPAFDPNRIPRLPDEGPNGLWDVLAYIDREKKANATSGVWLANVEARVAEEMKKRSANYGES